MSHFEVDYTTRDEKKLQGLQLHGSMDGAVSGRREERGGWGGGWYLRSCHTAGLGVARCGTGPSGTGCSSAPAEFPWSFFVVVGFMSCR